MACLSLGLFGGIQITLDGTPITRFRSDKARALLAYLALEQDRAPTRAALCGIFWGEQPEQEARHNLSQTLLYIQHALAKETVARHFEISRASIQFRRESDADIDAREFLQLWKECDAHSHRRLDACAACVARLERACALYRGELLAQFFLDDSPAFEEWLLVQREQFQRLAIAALSAVTAFYEAQGSARHTETLRYARRQVELEAWREEPYRVLMRTYAAMNQTDAALAEYHALAHVLRQELGLEPSAETNALYKHLRDTSVSSLAHRPSPLSTLHAPISNVQLPIPTTPLVGRAHELAQLSEKITRPDCRVLTLLGQGGIGKTRLALELARNHRDAFPRGIYFVDLADLTLPELVPHAIAEALQFHFRGAGSPAEQLIAHLQTVAEPLLLVLDNYEQLLQNADGTRMVSTLIKRVSHVTLLVTSRERLNLDGEWLFAVEGLHAPPTVPTRVPSDWDTSEAMQLLLQCVTRAHVNPQTWNETDKRGALRITQLVEGMPLALELASAWARTLAPNEIADEIERGLDVFQTTRRDLPARHASIRAVFAHSWKLLTEQEQNVFARLSVFRGGMTREAAREIAGASLQILAALVDKSLVKRVGVGRFRLHELVRQFAAEQLDTLDAAASTQTLHSAYYLNRVAQLAPAFNARGAQTVLEQLRHELDNVRYAWRAASAAQDAKLLARSLNGLADFYFHIALAQEGVEQFTFALSQLAADDAQSITLSSRLHAQCARLYTPLTQYVQVIASAQQAIALGQTARAPEAVAAGYLYWGHAVRRQGDYVRARDILEQALSHAHAANLTTIETEARTYLGGTFWNESAYAQAREHWQTALALARAGGNLRGERMLLNNLGLLAQERGEFAQARDYFGETLELSNRLGADEAWGASLANLGLVDLDQYAFDSARARLHQTCHLFRELQNAWTENIATLGLGQHAALVGAYEHAREHLETAVENLRALRAETDHARALGLLALVYAKLGESERAHETVERAIPIARAINDRFTLGKALLIAGHLAADEKRWDAAHNAYAEALNVYVQVELAYLQIEARAGMAYALFARGENDAARELTEPVYDFLRAQPLEGSDEPMRVYFTTHEILRAFDDARADEILNTARSLIIARADAMQSAETRASFLENVSWNRALLALQTP